MKKILFILLFMSATTVQAGEVSSSLRNVNDDMSGIIADEQPDILLNPAEISKLDRWKFHMGIDNLLNRSELLKQLNDESKSKSITKCLQRHRLKQLFWINKISGVVIAFLGFLTFFLPLDPIASLLFLVSFAIRMYSCHFI